MTRRVHLFGGPYHGKTIDLPDGSGHFHVVGPVTQGLFDQDSPDVPVGTREGTYSQVSGPANRNNFEWDGWMQ